MSDLVVHQPGQQLPERMDGKQLQYISSTEFVPKNLRGNLPAIIACVQTGRELGLGDMESLRSIYVVDGRPTLSAELMVRQVRRRGHSVQGESTPDYATATGKRNDNGDTMTVTWTMEMAKRAGLAQKQNWKNYPEAMLWARAVSQLCRMLFGDCLAGVVYTMEELEDGVDAEGGPLDDLPTVDPSALPVSETEGGGWDRYAEPEAEGAPDEDGGPAEIIPEGQSSFEVMAEKAQAAKAGKGGDRS